MQVRRLMSDRLPDESVPQLEIDDSKRFVPNGTCIEDGISPRWMEAHVAGKLRHAR